MPKVALMGTCNLSSWRDKLIPLLKPECEYFNPVIIDRPWTEDDRLNEIKQRSEASVVLYVLTPYMSGLYSIAELVDDSNKRPTSTVLFIQRTDVNASGKTIKFTVNADKSMNAIETLVLNNGAYVCKSLEEVADYLNNLN